MAAVSPTADEATDLIQKLFLEHGNRNDAAEAANEGADFTITNDDFDEHVGCMNNSSAPNASVPLYPRSITPLLQEYMDGCICYPSNGYPSTTYYCGGGCESSTKEWDREDYKIYFNNDGVKMPPPGVYGDMYHNGYEYAPYSSYTSSGSPVPTLGHDGQLYGPQHYQFPAPFYQSPAPTNVQQNANQILSSKGDLTKFAAADRLLVSTKATMSNSAKENTSNNGSAQPKSSLQYQLLNSNGSLARNISPYGSSASVSGDPRFGFDGMFDGPVFHDGQQRPAAPSSISSTTSRSRNTLSINENYHSHPHLMSMPNQRHSSGVGPISPGMMNRTCMNDRICGQNTDVFRNGFGIGSHLYDSRSNGRWGAHADYKFKNRGRNSGFYFGNEKLGGFIELNRGPRAERFRSQKVLGHSISSYVKGQSLPTTVHVQNSTTLAKDQFNMAEFPDTYLDARFFVIKSYSEDDIHKSVKYNVWASTPNGNKKLDAAYQEAQEKPTGCPVFLFFSVNSSGQFVGVAEMAGPVDFDKIVEYWQQDKWTGCFPVKWHIVKDVPNNTLKHITLENNDNKPVTNSRDTQEVKLEQGLQMLKIFKEHNSKASILDDFDFYENRQTIMQEERAKQQFQKKVMALKPQTSDKKMKDRVSGTLRLEAPVEIVTSLNEHGKYGVAVVSSISLEEKTGY